MHLHRSHYCYQANQIPTAHLKVPIHHASYPSAGSTQLSWLMLCLLPSNVNTNEAPACIKLTNQKQCFGRFETFATLSSTRPHESIRCSSKRPHVYRSFADCFGFRFGPKATGHRYLDCQCSSLRMGIQNYGCGAYYPCFIRHAFSCTCSP